MTRIIRFRSLASLAIAAALMGPAPGPAADPAEAEPSPMGGLPADQNPLGPQPGPDHPLQPPKNPYGMDPNVLQEGRKLFIYFNCYGCHGGRAGGGMGPSLRDAAWLYGNKEEDIFDSISEGRPHGMPAWGTKLPAQQIWKLTAYIKSLDTDHEPDPPPKNPTYPNPPPRRDLPGKHAGGGDH